MGLLRDGVWHTDWYDTKETGGHFKRSESQFRNWITADGAPGPSGTGGFAAESGRYHLYVSYACPWAHRTLIFRALKGLETHITVDVVHPYMADDGWTFEVGFDGATGDTVNGHKFLREVYVQAQPDATTRVTVPVLWDKKTGTIVSNESAEIIRMFNTAFNHITGITTDYYPAAVAAEIDEVNSRVYSGFNNGVYKAGFATTQDAYNGAAAEVFDTLDWLEDRLSSRRYVTGAKLTEADWRLATTLFRFDPVYHGHFKCNRNRLVDFPSLWAYARELYQIPGVAETVRFDHITDHYYGSHTSINPHRIIPIGPNLDWWAPHGRGNASAA